MFLSDDLITLCLTRNVTLPVPNKVLRGSHLNGSVIPSAGLLVGPRMKPILDISSAFYASQNGCRSIMSRCFGFANT